MQTRSHAIAKWVTSTLDPAILWFVLHALAGFGAFVTWQDEIVRAIRGEDAKDDWRVNIPTAMLITFWTLTTAARGREMASLKGAIVEMRGMVDDAAEQAELRDQRAAERAREDAEQQMRMLRFTKWLVALATLTLAAALVTLAVTIVS